MTQVLVIDLNPRYQECHRCGAVCEVKYGLPVGANGQYVPNWFDGDWAGVAACERCYRLHEAWSDQTDPRRKPRGRVPIDPNDSGIR